MIIYLGFIFIILSSIYTFSFAGQSWRNNNKAAAIGAVLLVFIVLGVALFLRLR